MDTSGMDKVAIVARVAIGICAAVLLGVVAAFVATAAANSGVMSSAMAPGGPFWQLLGPLLFSFIIGILIALRVLLGVPAVIRSLRGLAAMVPAFKVFALFFVLTTWGYAFFVQFSFIQKSPNVSAALVAGAAGLTGAAGEAVWMLWIAATVRQRLVRPRPLAPAEGGAAISPRDATVGKQNGAHSRPVSPPHGVIAGLPCQGEAWSRLQPILREGEHLRWAGQPDPRVKFARADLLLVPFGIWWGVGTVFFESIAIASGAPISFVLYGIPFLVVGLYVSVGRFIYKKRRKLMTVYALTDSRAIVSSSRNSFVDAPVMGAPMRIIRSRNGRHASVIFDGTRPGLHQNTGLDFLSLGQPQSVAFFDVADPDALILALNQVR
ncbi:hypothetical protein [Sinomonas atrocyanea]